MSRIIYFLTLFLAFIGATYAQVSAINTPAGSVANGASITITWSYTPQANALPGTLSVVDNTTKNTVIISSTINLSSQSFMWTVNVPAGTYYLALNDGSGDKYSGTFTVFQAGGTAPAAASGAAPAASGAAPAPSAAPAGGAPAAAGAAPSSSAAAPAAAQPSSAAKQPSSQPASPAESPKSPSASSGASNASPSSGKSSSSSSPTAAPTSDAAISFTGSSIKLLFSLIVVAAAMIHFA
ncbi:hypothetical protein C2G38_1535282 [Gigaspora rosea]|uniref:Yeast cell wall synthesis Kre9/Knh1-like N-terminal domain-containing protein n=1 Tax=Gigaspora rosea TaxID=44941 RepID=A0A397W7K5_9GLOM|nr:hypothetical protein C2G38_1535282 [Gigaspora rosea]